jgi:hypothetical protein
MTYPTPVARPGGRGEELNWQCRDTRTTPRPWPWWTAC